MQVASSVPYASVTTTTIEAPCVIRRLSINSVRSLNEIPLHSSAASFTSSAGSIKFDDEDVDVVTEDGLRHADITLEAR